MLIHKMENRKKNVSDFSFDYFVKSAEHSAIFWADEVSKYNMVFIPFTAIDNHRKCVTVVTGLLKNETTKSYIWLLKSFIKAFEISPSIVVTDQDRAMRNAIEAELLGRSIGYACGTSPKSFLLRNFYLFLIYFFFLQICVKIYDETDLKEKLNKIIWNMYIGPEEFEYRWGKLMEEFKLDNHKWLTKMFNIHSTWIPAYFIDSPLCGLMMMTSRSETMEKQRHIQERMDHKTIDTVPKLKSFLKIERHASNVYTRYLFELVQKELFFALWHCQIDSKSLVEGSEVCIIKESPYVYEMLKKKKKSQSRDKCKYVDKCKDKVEEDNPVDLFFKKDGLYKTKNLIPAALRNKRNRYSEKNVVVENFANDATSIVDYCVHLLSKDEPRLDAFVEKLKSLKKYVEADCLNPPSKNKTDNLEQLVGVLKPPVVEVNNPTIGSTKGQKKLCIKGGKEKAIEKSLKGRNSCSLCGGTDHNKRTCPGRFEVEDEVVLQKKVCQEEVVVQKEVCQEEVVQGKVDLAEDEEELVEEDEVLIHE
uniref:Protein FAR1-related sequence 5 n=1 Tax=Tanacetum cinerariifolium TaxID=118510 RepID=A0A6L2L2Q9_TANCI|nr:protein FAR1-related sequence 5 [Tanacetum cinerariifolium]